MELGLQLFTVRDYMHTEEDIRFIFQKLSEIGYTQVQTAGCEIPYDTFYEIASEAGLEIVGTHDDFELMVNDFPEALRRHEALHTKNMGVGGYQFTDVASVEEFIRKANEVAANCARYGMKFNYHNHSHEFSRLSNGKTVMDMLIEGLDPENTSFVFDVYWGQVGGVNVASYLKNRLKGRVDIVHLKDLRISKPGFGSEQMITECGQGNLDFKEICDVCREIGVKYYVVEQDRGFRYNCIHSVKDSYEYLKKLLS